MITFLLSLNVVIFVFVLNYLFSQRKKLTDFQEKLDMQQKLIEQITKDHPVLIHADLLFSKQLKEINTQLISMDNQIQDLENKRANDGGYRHALRILEMGEIEMKLSKVVIYLLQKLIY